MPRDATRPPPSSRLAGSPAVDVELSVPEGAKLHAMVPRMTLDICPEANMAVMAVGTPPGPSSPHPTTTAMVADLRTGELSPIAGLVGKGRPRKVQLSPDRKRLLVSCVDRAGASVYAMAIPGGMPVNVAAGRVMAVWAAAGLGL